jgi:transcriptional regulator with XRE-family HTH domain
MYELIGRGVAQARRRKGLTQEQLAKRFQGRGLTAWRKGTVGQLEAGLRRPRLDEVLLMAAALGVSVDQLIPVARDELVELGDGATVSARWIREMLTGEYYRDPERPAAWKPYAHFPVMDTVSQVIDRVIAEHERYRDIAVLILDWAERHAVVVTDDDWRHMFSRPSDTERHVARRLSREIPIVKLSARILWDHRDFDDERDRRVGDIDTLEPRSRQARRGLVTREMLAELGAFLDEAGIDRKRDGDGER